MGVLAEGVVLLLAVALLPRTGVRDLDFRGVGSLKRDRRGMGLAREALGGGVRSRRWVSEALGVALVLLLLIGVADAGGSKILESETSGS